MSIDINEYINYFKDTEFMDAEIKELEESKDRPFLFSNLELYEAFKTYIAGKYDYLLTISINNQSQYICVTQEAAQKLTESIQKRITDNEIKITNNRQALMEINKYNETAQANSAVALDSNHICGIFYVENYGEKFYYLNNNGSSVEELLQKYAECNGQLNELVSGCTEIDAGSHAWYEQNGILNVNFNVDRNELRIRQGNETEENIRSATYNLTDTVEGIKQHSAAPEKMYTLSFTENELKMLNAGLVQLSSSSFNVNQTAAILSIINKFPTIGGEIESHNTLEDNNLTADDELSL